MKYCVLLAIAAALAGCAHGSNGASAQASASAAAAKNPGSTSDGATIYLANCSSCHQRNGQGLAGAFPPLAGNPAVTGNPIAVIAIVKNGLTGKLVVNGQAYSGIMPSWRNVLGDDQLAAVISYIRSAWHNNASGVTLDQVREIK